MVIDSSQEEWMQWFPIDGLSPRYSIIEIVQDLKNFRILLADESDSDKKLRVVFENSIDVYRLTDEGYRLNLLGTLDKQYGTSFYAEWSFFKVKNSRYIRWIERESCGFFDPEGYIHFVFIDSNNILEIVVNYEPRFEFVTSTEKLNDE